MEAYIPAVTVNNVADMPFDEMLDGLAPFCLEEIPEGAAGDPELLHEIDRLLGRFANLYAYLIVLYATVKNEATRMKIAGASEEQAILTQKKDALYELSRAVKLKHQACSRMLTAHQETDDDEEVFDRPNYQARAERKQERISNYRKKMPGWRSVSD